jgi:DNA-binding LacI/PurR family transcriptional regulator
VNNSAPKKKPTLRAIAERAGVSHMAVSLALRDSPRIPAETREKIKRVAAEMRYQPDPQLSKLMFHLRKGRQSAFKSTIAALTTIPVGMEQHYVSQLAESARRRASVLGYGFELFRFKLGQKSAAGLGRILRSRGVEGVLLLPMQRAVELRGLLDWSHFAVVAATYGVIAPEMHRVVPHQFGNTLLLCRQLAQRGFRRIGLVMPEAFDLNVNYGFSGAVAWHNMRGGAESVAPLIIPQVTAPAVREWFRRERPDVIILAGESDKRLISDALGREGARIEYAVTDWTPDARSCGIDERPEEIGAAAIDLLNAKILTGERGVPVVPSVLMVGGRWVE